MNTRQTFLTEYNDLRDQGETHTTIARHYGIQRESLLRKLHRANAYRPEPHERHLYQTLNTLIEKQATFTASDLPPAPDNVAMGALRRAVHHNLIRPIGYKPGTDGNKRRLYTANLQPIA